MLPEEIDDPRSPTGLVNVSDTKPEIDRPEPQESRSRSTSFSRTADAVRTAHEAGVPF